MPNLFKYATNYVLFKNLVLSSAKTSVSDPHSLYADPDPAFLKNADPDPFPDPYPNPMLK
jgi:hypothetical protein